jgi:hypothetical protein
MHRFAFMPRKKTLHGTPPMLPENGIPLNGVHRDGAPEASPVFAISDKNTRGPEPDVLQPSRPHSPVSVNHFFRVGIPELLHLVFHAFLQDVLRGVPRAVLHFAEIPGVEPHGQEPVAPMLRRNPPKLQSSFAKASEDTRIPPRSGDRGFLRRRVKAPKGRLMKSALADFIERIR